MQNPQMAMAGMNAAGGPVGGAQMMNNTRPGQIDAPDSRTQLNTYIYDYFLKNNNQRVARAMMESDIKINFMNPSQKPSPSGRNMNGVDAMEDSKDDLPLPKIPEYQAVDNAFLLDWWFQFWDMYSTARKKGNGQQTPMSTYLTHTRNQAQMRNDAQQRLLMQNNMNARYPNMHLMNGVNANELQKRAAMNNGRPNPQQVQQMNQMNKQMMSAQMQRDGSNMDMNGQRPQSPGSAQDAPSPNKRPRVEGNNAFNGQPMGGARTQGMPQQPMGATSAGQANQMLLAGGMNVPGQFGEFAQQAQNMQPRSIEVYAQSLVQQQRTALNNVTMAKGMNPGAQGSPAGQQGLDGSSDLFTGNPRTNMQPGAPGAPPAGNHALQDYQMQLMLLEQQNKKRLLMARQEQETIGPHGQGSVAGGFAPSMSPQGSRAGPSPNPADQMKRTPKLPQQGLPGSPMPDGSMPQNRNSPIPNFDPNQVPPGMPPQFFPQVPGNQMNMRPPSSHPQFNGQFNQQQMQEMARNGAMQNGAWRGGAPPQMMPNQGQQPGPMGTPQQRAMPPPPAPPSAEQPGRTQPPSPQQPAAAPPTPSQTNKANPKKNAKNEKKKPTKKNTANTGATPASEAEPPPTPTPSTPITPIHPSSFKGQNGQQPQQQQQQQPQQPPAAAQAPQVQPQTMDAGAPFGNIVDDGNDFNLNFGALDGPDVLDNFDFDSFLHTNDESGAFGSLGTDFNFGPDGVEAGTGDLA